MFMAMEIVRLKNVWLFIDFINECITFGFYLDSSHHVISCFSIEKFKTFSSANIYLAIGITRESFNNFIKSGEDISTTDHSEIFKNFLENSSEEKK